MATMKRLVRRFNRMLGDWFYEAELDTLESRPGWYRVYIVDPMGISNLYTFSTAREFREWMDGVVME